jgi:hypothetical protein
LPEERTSVQKVYICPTAVVFSGTDSLNDFYGWTRLQTKAGELMPAKFLGKAAAGAKIFAGVCLRFALTPPALFAGTPFATEMDIWTVTNWMTGLAPLIGLLGLLINPLPPGSGMVVATLIGYAQLGLGIATDVEQAKLGSKVPFNIARNVIAPLPNIAKSALLVPGEPEATACLLGVYVVNTLCDLAVGSLALAADLT